jgi:hypothetical protein
MWTDEFVSLNNFYTGGGFLSGNISEFILGSNIEEIDIEKHIVGCVLPYLKSLNEPYKVKSFDLYIWDYSIFDIEEPTFISTYILD